MNFGLDILHIGGFINNNLTYIIIAAVLAVLSAAGCAIITMMRRGFMDDIILSAVFGLVFNVMGLLFVFFRKPVWNNLGWIPVVIAWFFLQGNFTFALMLIAYAVGWMIFQHILYDKIKVIEE